MATLNVIPYASVQEALQEAKQDFRETREYNTAFHTREEITAVLPHVTHFNPEDQPWILLEPWLDLITSSRGLQENDIHRILLPGKFLVQLIHASRVGLQLGRISADDAEDLADTFPKLTIRGDCIEDLIQKNRFFIRLDTCSLKDAIIAEGSVQSTTDLWTRLATSARGMTELKDLRKAGMPIYMYLFPWDDMLQTDFEYRVYCPPDMGKIAAISQYKSHAPWYHADVQEEHERIADRLLKNCEKLHEKIVAHPAMTELLGSRGFVFDVVADPVKQDVRLIELDDFGALSGCGACLFHWVRDARLLYGLNERVEVRVTF
ncbi:hypothetical protein IMSHALPRED_001364 [Imshaugia aleurites]|uniref:Uncharacterized protein n=1 Tax=Imshaugia aleurites TaxID=172621 RepID=A0A8H3J2G6_9LECA|nr:hypothetical protein IMSHALPRED_001364 [Imshaugia aleurites]